MTQEDMMECNKSNGKGIQPVKASSAAKSLEMAVYINRGVHPKLPCGYEVFQHVLCECSG